MSHNFCVVLFWAQYSIRHFTQTEEVTQTPIQIEKIINMFCGKTFRLISARLTVISPVVMSMSRIHPTRPDECVLYSLSSVLHIYYQDLR